MALVQIPAPETNSLVQIATGSLSVGNAATNITGIPGTYTDLRLIVRNHETQTAQTSFDFRVNSNTGSLYYSSDTNSTNSSAATSWNIRNPSPANTPNSVSVITIHNYASTSPRVGSYIAWGYTGSVYYRMTGTIAFNNSTAITSLNILAGGGESWDGGTYEVWGIK
jgi:hypothetical protein